MKRPENHLKTTPERAETDVFSDGLVSSACFELFWISMEFDALILHVSVVGNCLSFHEPFGICSNCSTIKFRQVRQRIFSHELEGVPTDGYLEIYIWPSNAEQGYLGMNPKCDGRPNIGLVTVD